MKVTLLNACHYGGTGNGERLTNKAAAMCVGKVGTESSNIHLQAAVASGHFSILEHLPLTWLVEYVSRALTHQLVRHRIASYSQLSQRYAKVDTDSGGLHNWYVIPESIANDSFYLTQYKELMIEIAALYRSMCQNKIPGEDARFILPNACHTSIIVTMNARSFLEACQKRLCNKAQWEIRELFGKMRDSIETVYPTVYKLANTKCHTTGCTERNPCSV